MSAIVANSVLQAIAFAILNSFWQMALLWLIYTVVCYLVKLSARTKFIFATTLYLGGFVWFLYTLACYLIYAENILNTSILLHPTYFLQDSSPFNIDSFITYIQAYFIKFNYLLPYLSIVYVLTVFLLFIKLILEYNKTQDLKYFQIQKVNAEWRLFVKQTAAILGIKKEVKVYLSEQVSTPLTIGFFKPIILVPLASLNKLTSYQMEAVLLHELAHIKRYDYLVNIILCFIDIIMFFNPFSRLIKIQLQNERENCCDDWVLQFKYNSQLYSDALLQIASLNTKSVLFGMPALQGKTNLLNRIRRMNNNSFTTKKINKNKITTLITCFFSIIIFSWLLPDKFQNKTSLTSNKNLINKFHPNNPIYLRNYIMGNEKNILTDENSIQIKSQTNFTKSELKKENKKYVKEGKVKNSINQPTLQYQAKMNKLISLKKQFDSLSTIAKTNLIQNQPQEVVVNTKFEDKDELPTKYALNLLNDSSYVVSSNSYINDVEVTTLTIKRKNFIISDSIKVKPKLYDVVISNEGKPDKRIIIEIWQ